MFFEPTNVFLHAGVGSGKTTSLLMAMAGVVDENIHKLQGIFFGPTVEAVVQAQNKFRAMVKYMSISTSVVVFTGLLNFNVSSQILFGTPLELAKKLK